MRPAIHMISLLGILSLSLLSISGCGEKRIHVSTASGSPGEETGSSASGTDTAGLTGTSLDESPCQGKALPTTKFGQRRFNHPLQRTIPILVTTPTTWMNRLSRISKLMFLLGKTPKLKKTVPAHRARSTREMTSRLNPVLQV